MFFGEPTVHFVADARTALEPVCGTGNFESYAVDWGSVNCPDCLQLRPFTPDASLSGNGEGPDELVEIVGVDADGSTRVRHADGSESANAPYLILRLEG